MPKPRLRIPQHAKIETQRIPVEWLYHMALREGNSKKPIYRIHKWWARRLGSVFRTLLLLSASPAQRRSDYIVNDFYRKHDLQGLVVLDPFMGGGTSIVESAKCNARTIGLDIDPVACFVTRTEIDPFPAQEFDVAVQDLSASVGVAISAYYVTQTIDGHLAPVIYYFWVDVITCPQCHREFEAHPHFQLHRDQISRVKESGRNERSVGTRRARQVVFCRSCHTVRCIPLTQVSFTCQQCGSRTRVTEGPAKFGGRFTCPHCEYTGSVASTIPDGHPLEKRLFAVEYETEVNGRIQGVYKAADAFDFELYETAKRRFRDLQAELPYPRNKIPTEGRNDKRPTNYGYKYYDQLFNARQLLGLSLLWREILSHRDERVREFLVVAFSDSLASNNLLCSYAFDYGKLTPLFGLHAFNVVNRPVENNVWGTHLGRGSFLKCVHKMTEAKKYGEQPYETKYADGNKILRVYTGERATTTTTADPEAWREGRANSLLMNRSANELTILESKSVDLVLTDPPYFDNLSYSELSDFYFAWLRKLPNIAGQGSNNHTTPFLKALYASDGEHSSVSRYASDLSQIFAQCRRVLRADGIMVFTFHHRDLGAWLSLAIAAWRAGFSVTNVFPVRSEGKSGFHSAPGTIKWDAVLVCRKREQRRQAAVNLERSLRMVRRKQARWESRLREANMQFDWADLLSLGYAFAVMQAVNNCGSANSIQRLLEDARIALHSKLTPNQIQLLRE